MIRHQRTQLKSEKLINAEEYNRTCMHRKHDSNLFYTYMGLFCVGVLISMLCV